MSNVFQHTTHTSVNILTNVHWGVGKIRFVKGISRKNKEFWGKIPFFCDILPIFGWF